MFAFLERIQHLPKERRRMFAFAVASSFTALVAAVWFVDLDRRFSAPKTEVAADELRGDLTPFAAIKRSAGELVEGTKARLQSLEQEAAALSGFSEAGSGSSSTTAISTTTLKGMASSTPSTEGSTTEIEQDPFESATTTP